MLGRENPIFLVPGPMEFVAGFEIAPGEVVVPLGGVPNVPTAVWVTQSDEPDIYLSDRFGFRNPDKVWDTPHVRLAAVGDSFTFGAQSTIENSIVGRLRSLEPSTVNLGNGGNGPLTELATIREYLTPAKPEIVIWFYYRNDLEQDLDRVEGKPVPFPIYGSRVHSRFGPPSRGLCYSVSPGVRRKGDRKARNPRCFPQCGLKCRLAGTPSLRPRC